MKLQNYQISNARHAIEDRQLTVDDSYTANDKLLQLAQKHDMFSKIEIPNKPLEHIQISDINLPSIWAVLRDWKFWKAVIAEVAQIVIYLIIKSSKK
jgi:hypothetical protein